MAPVYGQEDELNFEISNGNTLSNFVAVDVLNC